MLLNLLLAREIDTNLGGNAREIAFAVPVLVEVTSIL